MSRVEKLTKLIKETLVEPVEFHQLHRAVGDMIERRMFYQLSFTAPWVTSHPEHVLFCDHTDRFEEVCADLCTMIRKSLEYEQVDQSTIPDGVLDTCDEQMLANVMYNHLPYSCYSYHIEQFEVAY